MAVIHEEVLRLPRYDEMTFPELMERANYCRAKANREFFKSRKRKWTATAVWICEIAAKNMGVVPLERV